MKKFYATSDTGYYDCAHFHMGVSDDKVEVENGESVNNLYLYVKDSADEAVSYDEYRVEAADDDIISVSTGAVDSGKFAVLSVTGLKAGSTKINITATKNGAASEYTIPVEVYEIGEPVKMEITAPSVVSNVYDTDYTNEVSAKMLDANNREIKEADYEYKIESNAVNPLVVNENGGKGVLDAKGKTARSYTVQVTGTDRKSNKQLIRNVSVQVKALPDEAYKTENGQIKGINLTYSIELDHKKLDLNPYAGDDTVRVRLVANYNGLFAGYVRGNAADGITVAEKSNVTLSDGNTASNVYVNPTSSKKLQRVVFGVKQASARFDVSAVNDSVTTANLMTTTSATTGAYITMVNKEQNATGITANGITFNALKADSSKIIYTGDRNATMAKTGSYTVECALQYDDINTLKDDIVGSGNPANNLKATSDMGVGSAALEKGMKYAQLSTSFTVENSMKIPTVKIGSKTVEGSDFTSITKMLTTDIDLNQTDENIKAFTTFTDASFSSTIAGLTGTDQGMYKEFKYDGAKLAVTAADAEKNSKISAKYILVSDKFKTNTWYFFVPINTTFTVK